MTPAVPVAKLIPEAGFAQAKYTAGFSEILQRVPGERKAIAQDLEIPYGTLDNYIRGTQSFPPDLISRLFAITGDWSILRFILEPLGLQAVHKATANRSADGGATDPVRSFMDIAQRLGESIREYREAQADGSTSPSEFARLNFFLCEIERECAEAREAIKAEVK